MKKIRAKMNENILNGEIYNPKIEEIIACILLGDWPYVFGPSGAGKGYMVNQIGDLLDRKICDNGKITDNNKNENNIENVNNMNNEAFQDLNKNKEIMVSVILNMLIL